MTRKKIGLALSGGGARGFAHVGVLKALVDNNIPIDYIAGTSAGSFVGAAFAAGLSVEQIIELGKKVSWFSITGLSYSPKGILSSTAMGNLIRRHFPVQRFEELQIPFAAVACDLETGNEVVLKDEGDLAFAVRASCAIPGVFMPITDRSGRRLIDGGIASPVPVAAVRELGADIVIAVDLLACGATFFGSPRTLLGMLFQSAMLILQNISKNQHYDADVVIIPEIAHLRPDEIRKRDEFIELGEKAALVKMIEIQNFL